MSARWGRGAWVMGVIFMLTTFGCASLSKEEALQRINAEITWVPIEGGTFMMGCDEGTQGCGHSSHPRHQVNLASFEMSKHEVSLRAYRACVEAGGCSPADGDAPGCLWDQEGRETLPVNCVTIEQARAFADFVGARLPSEAEWEYAARSEGKDQRFPWGDDAPTCEHLSVNRIGDLSCQEEESLLPAPSGTFPFGESEQGVSDLVGNLSEWVADCYDDDYTNAKANGSPLLQPRANYSYAEPCYEPGDFIFSTRRVECPEEEEPEPRDCKYGVVRGGFFLFSSIEDFEVSRRVIEPVGDDFPNPLVGIRLAR